MSFKKFKNKILYILCFCVFRQINVIKARSLTTYFSLFNFNHNTIPHENNDKTSNQHDLSKNEHGALHKWELGVIIGVSIALCESLVGCCGRKCAEYKARQSEISVPESENEGEMKKENLDENYLEMADLDEQIAEFL